MSALAQPSFCQPLQSKYTARSGACQTVRGRLFLRLRPVLRETAGLNDNLTAAPAPSSHPCRLEIRVPHGPSDGRRQPQTRVPPPAGARPGTLPALRSSPADVCNGLDEGRPRQRPENDGICLDFLTASLRRPTRKTALFFTFPRIEQGGNERRFRRARNP